jgi:hypothetical protein
MTRVEQDTGAGRDVCHVHPIMAGEANLSFSAVRRDPEENWVLQMGRAYVILP